MKSDYLLVVLVMLAAFGLMAQASARSNNPPTETVFMVAQNAAPPTGSAATNQAAAAEQRMQGRFPQPVRVGDLIGLPVLDDSRRTIGFVRYVGRTPQGKVELIVSYGGWFGWGERLVVVPIEVVGIEGRQLASLDMPRSEYAVAPNWQPASGILLPDDASIAVGLGRN